MVQGKHGTILIVEDDEAVARLQQRRLQQAGYPVVIAASVKEATQKIKAGEVELVLLDYRLPGELTGLDIYAHLKASGRDIPVIMVTGYGDEATVIQALRVGVRDFVTKSIKYLDYLPEAVERVLKQVQVEKQLAESEARLAAIVNSAMDAIVTMDLQDRILFLNPSAERLYGWTAIEAVGRDANELLFHGPLPELKEANAAVMEVGEWLGELPGMTRDGKEILVASRWTLVRDEEGQPKSKLVINTDITEKKKLEAKFLRTQRMESIGALAGGIAHDLNNVLTPILMAVELLEAVLPNRHESLLAPLRTNAQRGAEMVKQILSFARGVEGKRADLQLKHIVRDIEKMLQHTLPKSIEVHTNLSKDLWLVCGDATQFSQVIMNLCVNARDAMPGGGRLTVHAQNKVIEENCTLLHPAAHPGSYVVLQIADTGTGIPADILNKVFDPFFTTKEPGKGTGLGLSTSLGIVRSHGGFITVETEVGRGTAFSIYLPAVESVRNRPTEQPVRHLPCGSGECVLVADDEASIRGLTKITLEAHGYRVLTADNGTQAVDLYAKHKGQIQAVLTDMNMPGMDGLATARALQNLDPSAQVIVMSGTTVREGTGGAGTVRGFLSKPYTAESLLTTLRGVLEFDPHRPARSTDVSSSLKDSSATAVSVSPAG